MTKMLDGGKVKGEMTASINANLPNLIIKIIIKHCYFISMSPHLISLHMTVICKTTKPVVSWCCYAIIFSYSFQSGSTAFRESTIIFIFLVLPGPLQNDWNNESHAHTLFSHVHIIELDQDTIPNHWVPQIAVVCLHSLTDMAQKWPTKPAWQANKSCHVWN